MTPNKLIEKANLPESFHEIDEDDLAGEWVKQPGIYLQTAIKLADAEKKESEAKAAFEECAATIGREVREHPEKFRVAKISNETVDNAVRLHPKYKEALIVHQNAVYLVKLLKAATSTLEHKKKALENLVYLAGQGMHAAPRAKEAKDVVRLAHGRKKKSAE